MQISSGKVVTIDYTLTDDAKQTLDTSAGGEPLAYIHGNGHLISGLEKALEGKEAGAKLIVDVPAAEGYGERDDKKIMDVPIEHFKDIKDLKVGLQLHASSQRGEQVVTVTKIEGGRVILDANHPLAGQNLHFDVTIRDVRDATPEEVSHGHVHGPGGHHH